MCSVRTPHQYNDCSLCSHTPAPRPSNSVHAPVMTHHLPRAQGKGLPLACWRCVCFTSRSCTLKQPPRCVRSRSPSGSMSLAEVIREREKQKMMDPSSRPGSGPMTPVERDMARHGLTKTFDPSGGAAPQARAAGGASGAAALDFSDMKTFLTTYTHSAVHGMHNTHTYAHRCAHVAAA